MSAEVNKEVKTDGSTPNANLPEEVTGKSPKVDETPPKRTYTDKDVDDIVKRKKLKWGKKMETDIKQAVENATKVLEDKITKLSEDLETERNEKKTLQDKSILNKKINKVKEKLVGENVINADLLLPHINFDNLEVDEEGNVELGGTIADLKGKFPNAFGIAKVGTGGIPAKSGKVEQLTDVQRANDQIRKGNNTQALESLLKAGKLK